MANQSVSITLNGDIASIVLPRGHELVKHLETLITQKIVSPVARPPKEEHPAAAAAVLATLARPETQAPSLPALPRRFYTGAMSPQAPMVSSPSHSDSSTSSNPQSGAPKTGVRRRRAGTSQSNAKKCQVADCDKISVSRGLCRGHGGGRRCQHEGCTKGAQSRSDFCWAHGGGQRCEVPNCMRSRKSKRFCVAHLSWETVGHPIDNASTETKYRPAPDTQKPLMPRVLVPAAFSAPSHAARLPSLQQALRRNQCVSGARLPTATSPPLRLC
ncbi:hypothetical protein PINS_up012908 [Pythium insidiosum]|nr:hypothetical protein PINS_up012908 [Pythium insidiosum]